MFISYHPCKTRCSIKFSTTMSWIKFIAVLAILLLCQCAAILGYKNGPLFLECYNWDGSENDPQNCTFVEEDWYYKNIHVQRVHQVKPLFNRENFRRLSHFQHLELHAYPVLVPSGRYKARVCLNISWKDLKDSDFMTLEYSLDDGEREIIHLENFQPQALDQKGNLDFLCYWNEMLIAVDAWTVQLTVYTNSKYSEFRFRLPDWEHFNHKMDVDPCVFHPFVYSTFNKISVQLENCTSKFDVTLVRNDKRNKAHYVKYIENVTLNHRLETKIEKKLFTEDNYYSAIANETLPSVIGAKI